MANGHGGARRGAGRPPKEITKHRLLIMEKAIEDVGGFDEFWKKMFKLAMDGNASYARLCCEYYYGKVPDVSIISKANDTNKTKRVVAVWDDQKEDIEKIAEAEVIEEEKDEIDFEKDFKDEKEG